MGSSGFFMLIAVLLSCFLISENAVLNPKFPKIEKLALVNSTIYAVVGEDLTLPCMFGPSGGRMYMWRTNQVISIGVVKLTRDERFRLINHFDLRIHPVALKDAGDYLCYTGKYPEQKPEAFYRVIVTEPQKTTAASKILSKTSSTSATMKPTRIIKYLFSTPKMYEIEVAESPAEMLTSKGGGNVQPEVIETKTIVGDTLEDYIVDYSFEVPAVTTTTSKSQRTTGRTRRPSRMRSTTGISIVELEKSEEDDLDIVAVEFPKKHDVRLEYPMFDLKEPGITSAVVFADSTLRPSLEISPQISFDVAKSSDLQLQAHSNATTGYPSTVSLFESTSGRSHVDSSSASSNSFDTSTLSVLPLFTITEAAETWRSPTPIGPPSGSTGPSGSLTIFGSPVTSSSDAATSGFASDVDLTTMSVSDASVSSDHPATDHLFTATSVNRPNSEDLIAPETSFTISASSTNSDLSSDWTSPTSTPTELPTVLAENHPESVFPELNSDLSTTSGSVLQIEEQDANHENEERVSTEIPIPNSIYHHREPSVEIQPEVSSLGGLRDDSLAAPLSEFHLPFDNSFDCSDPSVIDNAEIISAPPGGRRFDSMKEANEVELDFSGGAIIKTPQNATSEITEQLPQIRDPQIAASRHSTSSAGERLFSAISMISACGVFVTIF